MKNYIYSIVVLGLVFQLTSCQKDFLDREPLDLISDEAVFEDEGYALSILYRLYTYMPNGYPGRGQQGATPAQGGYAGFTSILDNNTDLSLTKSGWIETWRHIRPGNITPTNNPLDVWEPLYQGVNLANSVLEGIKSSSLSSDFKDRMTAETRFIRAIIYFELVKRYGDVPLITVKQTLDDEILVARNSASEIYSFIDTEFTAVADVLPSAVDLPDDELGRATKEAAWAFNGRAQLFAKNYTRSAQLSKQVIDSKSYTLSPDYNLLFQSHGGDSEVIFETLFNGVDKGHGIDKLMLPFSFRSDWGAQCNPTQEFVDSYEMANGLPISDPQSGYDLKRPYEGKDPRFYATVIYHGAPFMGRNVDMLFPDGEDAPLRTGLHTISGYYITKFMDQSAPFGVNFGESKQSWKEIRLAEVLLNYAEAQNETAGPDLSVYEAINSIRQRAGMPDIPTGLSKEEMLERVMHERKIELALEGHRFWDLRRWGIAEEVLNNKVFTGMKVLSVDPATGEMETERFPIDFRPTTVFLPKFNLFPIPQREIDKNPNLSQNPGY